MRGFRGAGDLVDHAQIGPGEDGFGGIQLGQEGIDLAVAGVISEAENVDPEDAAGGIRQDVGIGGQECPEQFPGMGLLALRLHDGKHHAGFGAVGDHADDVEEEAFA